jgi:FAD/FMN-containing dehydrogenase/Fe-S oxidoreductase
VAGQRSRGTTAIADDATVREVAAALRGAGVLEVEGSTRRRAEYSSDASNYRLVPTVVVFPRHRDEVAAVIGVCRDLGIPLVPRGAGTSIAGNAVSSGVVLDFSRHLNKVLSLDPVAATARVQPGTILDDLQAAAAPHGLRFGPDPSTHARCTLGGMIGNNACGSRALGYGRTADNVIDLDLLLADGRTFTASRRDRGVAGDAGAGSVADLRELGDVARVQSALLPALGTLVAGNLALIRTEFGRFNRQISGYSMEHLLPENGVDLARMMVGTEGTLAVIESATVRLARTPPATALAVLGYPDMAAAADAVPDLLPHHPLAMEGLDARLVQVIRERGRAVTVPDLPRGEGWLFVETAGSDESEARASAQALAVDGQALASAVVTGAQAAALWRIREDGAGLAGRTAAGAPAWPGWEDAAVPPERLGAYLRGFFALLADHELDTLAYGHFGDGCVHARIDFPLSSAPSGFRSFLVDAARLVAAHGGSMSGEHGDGRARGELLPHMYSEQAIALLGAVKHAFDPDNLLNPGVIVDPAPLDDDLRLASARPVRRDLAFTYPDDAEDLSTAVHRCVGVGKCRADLTTSGGVMCPSYLATRDEKDSTRGRARVLQEMANGSLIGDGWRSAEVHEALDLCLACKGCSSECPAGVDMATYKAEALHQRYRRRLRPPEHYALGWLPRWARLSAHLPSTTNTLLGVLPLAAAVKRLGGIDPRRPLPQFAAQTFRSWFAHRPVLDQGEPVLLWVDTFTDHFAPDVGKAAVRVLEDAGLTVQITKEPVCCGLTWITTGQLDGARRQLRRTLSALDPWLARGTQIVGLEPSCAVTLRSDAERLLAHDPRAAALGASVKTLAELLTARRGWRPPSLQGVAAVAQPHCHQRAVAGWEDDAALLAAAGAKVTAVGGCCGLAGSFGVTRGHYDVSVAVAETALLPAVRATGPATVILADGYSCRLQLEHLAGRKGVHLAELLAEHLST